MSTLLLALLACAPDGAEKPDPSADDCVPGAEVCNGADDDCDGEIDEDAEDAATWYADADGDGHGDADAVVSACADPGEGWAADGSDCDDEDPEVHPDAEEACGGLRDDDCDGERDEAGASGCADLYEDADGDGVGTGGAACLCSPEGDRSATVAGDCDDADPDMTTDCATGPIEALSPGATLVSSVEGARLGSPLPAALADGTPAWWVSGHGAHLVAAPASGTVVVEDVAVASVSAYPWGLADVDGDGAEDLLVRAWETHDEWENTLRATTWVLPGPHAGAYDVGDATTTIEGEWRDVASPEVPAVVGDVDGDGRTDALVAAWDTSLGGTVVKRLPPDGGSLRWEEAETLLEAPGVEPLDTVEVGDLDGDGVDDLALTLWHTTESALRVWRGPVVFPAALDAADLVVEDARGLAPAGDLDGDGLPEVVATNGDDDRTYVLPSPLASGVLDDLQVAGIGPEDSSWRDAPTVDARGDLDGDGLADLLAGDASATANFLSQGAVYVLHGPVRGTRDLSQADARRYGEVEYDELGSTLSARPGASGVAVAAPRADLGAADAGAVYLFAGW